MANHKSAKKRARQTIVKNARNTALRSETKTIVKNLKLAIEGKDKEKAATLLLGTQRMLGKLVKRGLLKTNTAARKTSRMTVQVNAL